MRSDKPEAVTFQNWVCDEVLPCIRRHGMYATDETLEKLIGEPDFGIQLLTKLKEEREAKNRVMEAHAKLQDAMERIQPMADYCQRVLNTQQTVTVTQIAQDYGYSARAFNELLRDMGVQFRQNEQWILYAAIKKKGYVQSGTVVYIRFDGSQGSKMFTKWTQQGRLFLYRKLKEKGIVPVMERN